MTRTETLREQDVLAQGIPAQGGAAFVEELGTCDAPEATSTGLVAAEEERLLKRGARLEYLTTIANTLEAAAGITAGVLAHSVALTGFGLGAVAEVAASLVVLHHMRRNGRSERRAMRLLGGAFLTVGLLTLLGALHSVTAGVRAEESVLGVLVLSCTITLMLGLGIAKARTGQRLKHAPLVANAKMTMIDGMLGVAVLLGLGANLALGWWWADPILGAAVAFVALREGVETWRGED